VCDGQAGPRSASTGSTSRGTRYLHADTHADGSFTETFILRIGRGELNGAPVDIPGRGSAFEMYFVIDAAGVQAAGRTTFSWGRAPDFPAPFCAGGRDMRAHNRAVEHLHQVGGGAGLGQELKK
jgi:hypothetical protein